MHILYLSLSVTLMDYGEVLDAPVVFPHCERRSCVDIPIVDDAVLENSELFNVSLERNELDSRITLDPVDGLVEITDNESMGTNRSLSCTASLSSGCGWSGGDILHYV